MKYLFILLLLFGMSKVSITSNNHIDSNEKAIDTLTIEGLWEKYYYTKPKSNNVDNPNSSIFIQTQKPDTLNLKMLLNNLTTYYNKQESLFLNWDEYHKIFFYYFPSTFENENHDFKSPFFDCKSYRYKGFYIKTVYVKCKTYLKKVATKDLYNKLLFERQFNIRSDSTCIYLIYQNISQDCKILK